MSKSRAEQLCGLREDFDTILQQHRQFEVPVSLLQRSPPGLKHLSESLAGCHVTWVRQPLERVHKALAATLRARHRWNVREPTSHPRFNNPGADARALGN